MATANLKSKPRTTKPGTTKPRSTKRKRAEWIPPIHTSDVLLDREEEQAKPRPEGGRPTLDWTGRVDNLLETMGLLAGDRVSLSADYVKQTVTIGAWRDWDVV